MNCTAALLNQPDVNKKYAECTNEQTTSHTQRNSDISLDLFTAPQEERPLLNNIDIDPDEHYFSKQPNSCRYSTPTDINLESGTNHFKFMHTNC